MSSNVAAYVVIDQFENILRKLVVEEHIPELIASERMLSATPPFPFSRPIYESKKKSFQFCSLRQWIRKRICKIPQQVGRCKSLCQTSRTIRFQHPIYRHKGKHQKLFSQFHRKTYNRRKLADRNKRHGRRKRKNERHSRSKLVWKSNRTNRNFLVILKSTPKRLWSTSPRFFHWIVIRIY